MKLGFIGMGNMGQAIAKGYSKANPGAAAEIFACDQDFEKLSATAGELGFQPCRSIKEVMDNAEVVILAVKPNSFGTVLPEVVAAYKDQLIVSIAAGITISAIESYFNEVPAVVRVMPNTPALVGQGMSGLCRNSKVSDESFAKAMRIFKAVGKAQEVKENLMDAVVGVSGSGPAYVYMFIEAMADGAVAQGLPRDKAYEFAAQTVVGSAAMVLETGLHPGDLKDRVCSPGGTTIDAVCSLEHAGFRNSVMEAVRVAAEKSKKLGE